MINSEWPERYITISEPITMVYEVTAGGFELLTVSRRETHIDLYTGEITITPGTKESHKIPYRRK